MIDFLGNSIYETDLSHIEAVEIINGNLDHIQRFIKLIYEWTMFQTESNLIMPKQKLELGNSGSMPTIDTYENINSEIVYPSQKDITNKNSDIDYKYDNNQKSSKFRILSCNENYDSKESNEVFKITVGSNTNSSCTPSFTTSVNTTILGQPLMSARVQDECSILNSIIEESSYEKEDTEDATKWNNDSTFSNLIKKVKDDNKKVVKNLRVSSFSPVANYKNSFGLYYEQHPDSAETRIKNNPKTYFSKNLNIIQMNTSISKGSLRDSKKYKPK